MGSGNNQFHERRDVIPKGYFAILVGHEDKLERFVIPVFYINHPLFNDLLKEAEAEYGFDHKGPITIPCRVEEFRSVQDSIDRDFHNHHHRYRHHNQYHHHHHHHVVGCFRV
jgi:SAUR family protein